MITSLLIIFTLYFSPITLYLLITHHRKIATEMYLFIKHKEVKFFALSVVRFMINLGASVASISVIGIFIPQDAVEVLTLVVVWIFGIILSMVSYYGERVLKD